MNTHTHTHTHTRAYILIYARTFWFAFGIGTMRNVFYSCRYISNNVKKNDKFFLALSMITKLQVYTYSYCCWCFFWVSLLTAIQSITHYCFFLRVFFLLFCLSRILCASTILFNSIPLFYPNWFWFEVWIYIIYSASVVHLYINKLLFLFVFAFLVVDLLLVYFCFYF